VLQASKELGLKQVLVTSTSETYGTAQYVPINELHPMVGQSPYSASKIAADQLAISYYRSFNLPVKIVRPFNTYGPRQSARAIIPTVITQILSGVKNLKLGNLTPTRDLTFVEDTIAGFFNIYKSEKLYGEIVNVGMNKEISVKNLIALISEIIGKELNVEAEEQRIRPENSEVERLLCDNSKLLQHTDWKPENDLRTGLKKTIGWLELNLQKYKTNIYNI
jgi:nucleoside-diphosphate-sugar epimerase